MKYLIIMWFLLWLVMAYALGEYDRPLKVDYEQELTDGDIIEWIEYSRYSHQFFVDNPQYDENYSIDQQRRWVKVYDIVLGKLKQ